MFKSLYIKNYALIDEINIEFDKGLSIITGETGAGKSIILGAITLILGNRADSNTTNNTGKKSIVEAIIDISEYNLKALFETNNIDFYENVILRREISPEGRSRAFINDSPVNLTILKEISTQLIDLHSQHDNLALNNKIFQTEIIDHFADNIPLLTKYQHKYSELNNLKKELSDILEISNKEKAEADYYTFEYEQLENANLQENELDELEKEQKQLSNIEEIKINLSKIHFFIENDDFSTITNLKEANKASDNISEYMPQAAEISQRLQSIIIDLQDITTEADTLDSNIEHEPARLEFTNDRLNILFGLLQKHNVENIIDLINIKDNFSQKLSKIENYSDQISKIEAEIKNKTSELKKLSEQLHKKRAASTKKFEAKIVSILQMLGMLNAKFSIDIQSIEDFTQYGTDNIKFLFSANKATAVQPISKVASGGELSRLMLAIKNVVSASKTMPTLIFDEIDTGISGEIASKMAVLMKDMSAKTQIINITHLPQIAAKGENHFFVFKKHDSKKTNTYIKKLTDQERITEIAKMLSGAEITNTALKNAKELLQL